MKLNWNERTKQTIQLKCDRLKTRSKRCVMFKNKFVFESKWFNLFRNTIYLCMRVRGRCWFINNDAHAAREWKKWKKLMLKLKRLCVVGTRVCEMRKQNGVKDLKTLSVGWPIIIVVAAAAAAAAGSHASWQPTQSTRINIAVARSNNLFHFVSTFWSQMRRRACERKPRIR